MATTNLLIVDITAGQNDKEVTANEAHQNLDLALTQKLTKAMADGNVTLGSGVGGEAKANMFFEFTGALTAQRDVIVPTTNKKLYICEANTTGGFGIRVKTSAGAAVVLADGERKILYGDGTDVIEIAGDAAELAQATADIATNVTNIATNVTDITTLQTEMINFYVDTPADKAYTVVLNAKYAFDVVEITHIIDAGSITMDLEIDAVDITGIAAISVTTSEATATATAANSVAVGNELRLLLPSRLPAK